MSVSESKVPDNFDQFDATLSLEDPMADYEKLLKEKMHVDFILDDEMVRNSWDKISVGASNAVWQMLFDTNNSTKDQLEKASILLKRYKDDACFYSPWKYNDWIVTVRDELLKRQMLDFWKNCIVAKELGPAWARDSDLFDDMDDPEPANFYKFAGCEAPWLREVLKNLTLSPLNLMESTVIATKATDSPKALKKISIETPLEDYKYNMVAQGYIDPDDEDAYKAIFADVRDIIWQLLFTEQTLTAENFKKSAELLEKYKPDACFNSPYDYNRWIPKVRDELLRRKYFEFWQNVIVKKELGLCWAGDSDYFDDMEDTKPNEFYTSGDELINKSKNK